MTSNAAADKAARAAEQAEALYQQGVALHRQGQLDAADQAYRQVLAYAPRHAGAMQLRGVVQMQGGNHEEAVKLIKRSLDFEPRNPQALSNLGNALFELKRYDEAIAALRLAVEAQPNSADALGNLGRALRRRRYYTEAVEVYRRAVAAAPDRPGLHSALGVALSEAGDNEGSVVAHARALELAPDRADLRNNLAHAHRVAGRNADAERELREALALKPDEGELHLALGRIVNQDGRFDEAIELYRQARDNGAENTRFEIALMFFQNHVLGNDPVKSRTDAIAYAKRRTGNVVPFKDHANDPNPDRPLRIGWVSSDFKTHPVGRFLVAAFREIDQSKLIMHAYSMSDPPTDPINEQIRAIVPNWRNIETLTDEEVAHQIRKDRIDVLIDLSGHTGGNRLGVFAYKPAPVAVTWLGYFATTGYEAIDYVLCNRWLLPESEENQWVEKPWRLEDTHWCYTEPSVDVAVVPTPALAGGMITFGSYNNFDKVNEPTIALWSRVINEVPNSRLLLRSSMKNPAVAERMTKGFNAHGIDGDRLVVDTTTVQYEEHMKTYGLLDIALDPFPYNGGTTTTEALYMGVPVLTLHGDRFVAHLAETNLQSAGLVDWIAKDEDEFVAKAKAFASDLVALDAIRQAMRPRVLASRLFNAPAFARELETAFQAMYRKWTETRRK
jgi:protein O-GlcNAc transferase